MLILNRKLNESIWIGDVKVTVTKIERGKCSLGVEAPPDVVVNRQEVCDRLRSQATQPKAEEKETK